MWPLGTITCDLEDILTEMIEEHDLQLAQEHYEEGEGSLYSIIDQRIYVKRN